MPDKVYKDKKEFDKANKAYGDSLNLFNTQNKFNAEFLSNFKKGFPTQDLKEVDWKEILNYVNKDKEKNANKVIDFVKNGYVPTKNERVLKPEDALYKAKINRGDGDRLSTGYFKKNSEVNTRSLMDFIGNDDTKNYKHGSVSTKKDNIENVSDYSEAEVKTLFGDSSKEKVFGYSHKNILDKNIKPVDTLRYNQQVPNIIGSIENKDNFDPSSNTYNDVHAVNVNLPIYKKPTQKPIYQPDTKPILQDDTNFKYPLNTSVNFNDSTIKNDKYLQEINKQSNKPISFQKNNKGEYHFEYAKQPVKQQTEDEQYQKWRSTLPKNLQYESDYDLKSFWKENPTWTPDNKDVHMTDKYKLPNHPTFSNESMYYKPGMKAVQWKGDKPVNIETQNYTSGKALQIQGKPSGYINEGNNTGRQEFRKGGWLDSLDGDNPIQDNTKVKAAVIPNQAIIQKSNLNKNKGTLKSIDRMPVQPLTKEEVKKGIKFTTDVAGMFNPIMAVAGSAMDMQQGDKTGALLGLIPGAKDFLTNKNMVTKLATKAFNLGIPNKVVQPSKKVIREAGKYIKGSAEVIEAKNDIGKPIVEALKSEFRNGGQLDGLDNNKFDMGGLLDGLDKGTQVPDATATAKPVVNLNFAVTPAQKQLVDKKRRQRELDENPASYNVMKDYVGMGIKEPGLQTSMDPIDLVGTGVYKGLAKALGAKEVAQGAKGLVSDAVKYAEKKSVKPTTASTTVKSVAPSIKQSANKKIDQNIIDGYTQREIDWLNSDEYIKRHMAATGKSKEAIIKERDKIFKQIDKTTINTLDNKADFAAGVYVRSKNKPYIDLYNTGDEGLLLNTADHEIKHAASQEALRPFDGLIDLINGPYKKYPTVNVKKWYDNFIPGETASKWSSRDAEQQVVSKRIMDLVEKTQGVKRGVQLTDDNIKSSIDLLKKEIKNNDQKNLDILTMYSSFKSKFGKDYYKQIKDMVNKAYVVPTTIGVGGLGTKALQQNKESNTGWLDNLK
jgi:uncharacterized protein YjgD (DUF1641 family)